MRWENGYENMTTCSKVILTDEFKLFKVDYYENGTIVNIPGSMDYEKSKNCNGKIIVNWPTAFPPRVYVYVYIDYENLEIMQACFENKGTK